MSAPRRSLATRRPNRHRAPCRTAVDDAHLFRLIFQQDVQVVHGHLPGRRVRLHTGDVRRELQVQRVRGVGFRRVAVGGENGRTAASNRSSSTGAVAASMGATTPRTSRRRPRSRPATSRPFTFCLSSPTISAFARPGPSMSSRPPASASHFRNHPQFLGARGVGEPRRRQGPLDAQVEHLVVQVLHHGEHRGLVLRLAHLFRPNRRPSTGPWTPPAAAAGIDLAHTRSISSGERLSPAVHRVEHLELFLSAQPAWVAASLPRRHLTLEQALASAAAASASARRARDRAELARSHWPRKRSGRVGRQSSGTYPSSSQSAPLGRAGARSHPRQRVEALRAEAPTRPGTPARRPGGSSTSDV